jgi:LacI family transcriptional regulator
MGERQDRAGIRDVAERAGVSASTVSRILNNTRAIAPEVAARVRRAIAELGYFPDTQARALVSGRSRMLGLIVSDITNPFFPELIHGFEHLAVRAGYEILLGSTNYDPAEMSNVVRRMLERNVEGVAVMTSEFDEALVARLAERAIPLVFIDVATSGPHVSNIRVDYEPGIRQAIQHLLRLGHRRIAFISGPRDLKSACLRRDSFLQCLKDSHMRGVQHLVIERDHSLAGGCNAVPELLSSKLRPTAVFCSNDLSAIGVLRGLDNEGLRAAADMSVVGFDDIRMAEFTIPPLTTIRLSRSDLARQAFMALMADLDPLKKSERKRVRAYSVETRLIVRNSTGKARR